MIYSAGFDVSAETLGTITLGTAGESSIAVNMSDLRTDDSTTTASAKHFHYNNQFLGFTSQDYHQDVRLPDWAVTSFGRGLRQDLQAAATIATWSSPSNIDVSFSLTTGLYTISHSAAISITFSSNAGRALMGVPASTDYSAATSRTFTLTPKYVMKPTHSATMDPTLNSQMRGIGNVAVNAAGVPYTIRRYRPVWQREWWQRWEVPGRVFIEEALTAYPWTLEHLFEYCGRGYPFLAYGGGFGRGSAEIFHLRDDGLGFAPEYASPNNATKYNVPFRTIAFATVNES